jgi:CcmD family protein
MQGLWPLVAAYAVIWAALFGYLAWIGREQARLRQEMRELRKSLPQASEDRHRHLGR